MSQPMYPEKIIFKKYETLEKKYKEKTKALGWGNFTDVLYSFLGIFALGVYILDSNNENKKYSVGNDQVIRIIGTKGQRLYTNKYIQEHFSEFSELAGEEEIVKFAKVYDSIGNIIPIWPGGNEFKGKSPCYDIPDIFFQEFMPMEKLYVEQILKLNLKSVALTRFDIGSTPYVCTVKDILNYEKNDYLKFVQHVVDEIELRTKEIDELMYNINTSNI